MNITNTKLTTINNSTHQHYGYVTMTITENPTCHLCTQKISNQCGTFVNLKSMRLCCSDTQENEYVHVFHTWCMDYLFYEDFNGCPVCMGNGERVYHGVMEAVKEERDVRVGIDVGGVILSRGDDADTSLFGDDYLNARCNDGAVEVIGLLVERYGEMNVFIVSKAGEGIKRKTLEWLRYNEFYEKTGMLEYNVHFCKTRKDKTPICEKLGITLFIDDHTEVLNHMKNIVPHRILFSSTPPSPSKPNNYRHDPTIITCTGWHHLLSLLN